MGIGEVIKRARSSRGQEWLAGELGVTQPTVSDWERGRRTPHPSKFGEIERVLGLRPGTLAEAAGYVQPVDARPRVDMMVRTESGDVILVEIDPAGSGPQDTLVSTALEQIQATADAEGLDLQAQGPVVRRVGPGHAALEDVAAELGAKVEELTPHIRDPETLLIYWMAERRRQLDTFQRKYQRVDEDTRRMVERIIDNALIAAGLDPDDPEVGG